MTRLVLFFDPSRPVRVSRPCEVEIFNRYREADEGPIVARMLRGMKWAEIEIESVMVSTRARAVSYSNIIDMREVRLALALPATMPDPVLTYPQQ